MLGCFRMRPPVSVFHMAPEIGPAQHHARNDDDAEAAYLVKPS